MNEKISALYVECCQHDHVSEFNLADITDLLEEIILGIYSKQGTDGAINEELIRHYAGNLWSGVLEGYGINEADVVFDSPDYNMLQSIKQNVWQFSTAKNYAQMRELSDALLDEEGNLVSFEVFKQRAAVITDKYMKQWLRTEYDLAVAGGQMAGKWVEIQKNRDTLPMLRFEAVLDGRTTEICRPLHGVTLPVDHPFWNRFYPPNHFNCRSTVRQLATGLATDDTKIPGVEIPEMFRTNLGKQGLVFPETHPYFEGLPESLLNRIKPS